MKKYLFIIFSFIALFVLSNSLKADSYTYKITSYDVNIVVNENNVLNITEKINANFLIAQHGIYRKIPIINNVQRLDGSSSTVKANISNIKVSDQYTKSREGNYETIKIGSPNNTITGSKEYTISYSYDLGKDKLKDADELYYNIIGDQWDTSISNVSFSITMPKSFDKSKLGFAMGSYGSTSSDNLQYSVDGNVISGKYDGILDPFEALTVRLELPEGYFVGAGSNYDYLNFLIIAVCGILTIISYMIWIKYGRDDKVIETVEFYPPEGYNSAEIGMLYKGSADSKDAVSLLIYLANKGYLKIEETNEKVLIFDQKSYKITKLKEYDGNNEAESTFFNGLFKLKNEVTLDELNNTFYVTIDNVLDKINNKKAEDLIIDEKTSKLQKVILLMIILCYMLVTIRPIFDSGLVVNTLFFGWVIPIISVFIIGVLSKGVNRFKIIMPLGFLSFGGVCSILTTLIGDSSYLITFIIGIVCMLLMLVAYVFETKRTNFGTQILGKLKGFRRFLNFAEKPKLEELVNQDPSYFYNILPFAYVLGVSDKWIKNFETIAYQPPTWYYGTDSFSPLVISSFMSSATSNMTSYPHSSGGSSGGGFSGGGSGGGGGGSW